MSQSRGGVSIRVGGHGITVFMWTGFLSDFLNDSQMDAHNNAPFRLYLAGPMALSDPRPARSQPRGGAVLGSLAWVGRYRDTKPNEGRMTSGGGSLLTTGMSHFA